MDDPLCNEHSCARLGIHHMALTDVFLNLWTIGSQLFPSKKPSLKVIWSMAPGLNLVYFSSSWFLGFVHSCYYFYATFSLWVSSMSVVIFGSFSHFWTDKSTLCFLVTTPHIRFTEAWKHCFKLLWEGLWWVWPRSRLLCLHFIEELRKFM